MPRRVCAERTGATMGKGEPRLLASRTGLCANLVRYDWQGRDKIARLARRLVHTRSRVQSAAAASESVGRQAGGNGGRAAAAGARGGGNTHGAQRCTSGHTERSEFFVQRKGRQWWLGELRIVPNHYSHRMCVCHCERAGPVSARFEQCVCAHCDSDGGTQISGA